MKLFLTRTILALAVIGMTLPAPAASRKKNIKPLKPHNHIAVIKSLYDKVDVALNNYQIPYALLELRDLEKPENINRYRAVFLPSGAGTPLENSLEIIASNLRFKSVALKSDFYEVDKEMVAKTIRQFVKDGGSVYFSGYSFEYLQMAFDIFEFYDNFPYMGLPERVETVLDHDLSRFSLKRKMALYFNHPGWITIKTARDSEEIARGSFETPRGRRTGPLSIIARRGSGEIVYTSYDSTVFSDFRRFHIYRIAGAHLLKQLEKTAGKWNQDITARIVNSIHNLEYEGLHRIDLEEGNNSVYFYSDGCYFQIDLLDQDMSLIESRDLMAQDQIFSIKSKSKTHCYIKLYPSTPARFGMYAVVSAAGTRIFPYYLQVLAAILIALVLAIAGATYRLFFTKGYSGRGGR
jgi:hypothetical protein